MLVAAEKVLLVLAMVWGLASVSVSLYSDAVCPGVLILIAGSQTGAVMVMAMVKAMVEAMVPVLVEVCHICHMLLGMDSSCADRCTHRQLLPPRS